MEAFTNSPLFFLAAFAVAFWVLKELFGDKKPHRRNVRYIKKRDWRKPDDRSVLATDQLQKVMAADFKPRSLLNRAEANVFRALDEAVIARNPRWQVMAQVSLGEFLSSPDKSAFLSVNSKRVDFALMDEKCFVQHALEYQGTGHHQGSAAARDAVKKEALRKAGIGYHEIVAGHTTPSELRALIEKLVPAA
ncbi:DUF2726 domain-containing protein [Altererythrobacter sp. CAU 1778]